MNSLDYLKQPKGMQPTERDSIFVIEDTSSSFIASILGLQGYDITQFNTSKSALTRILSYPPQLVVSKIIINEITGQSFSKQIRELTQLPYIPILLIAGHNAENLVQGLDSGADDFLRHPVEVDELLARVRSLLRLKHSIDERERMTRVREEFLSRLTHDLRTPLVAAERMFMLLKQGKYGALPDRAIQILASMQDNNNDLLLMTNTLLDIYRYEDGSKTLSFTVFNLQELIESVISELSSLVDNKKIQLKFITHASSSKLGVNPSEPIMIQAARLELRRVLTNLLGNSIKFTDVGVIQIQLTLQGQSCEIQVSDPGCGISPEDLPHVFDRFFQGQHRLSGYGLGLNLVQQIVKAHHGTICVQSKLDKGTSFIISLPLLPDPSIKR